ncbi:DUF2339 domain-containing protein [Saccharopolyspora taberi]|uniref:DUF2339 domain-containing protein n=1 Tax=Saccharopolyspora taberi TaxID=60895 RepID=A0ABN3VGH4_9PSEU
MTTSQVLAVAGGAVTLLGVVFLLVLAAQQGWLTPRLRVGGGALLGAALIGVAMWVHRRPTGKVGAYAVAATGFAALHLTVVAATALYAYLPKLAGLGLGLLVAGAGLALADRWRAQGPAIGVVVGCAACAPLITGQPDALLVGFLLVLQVAAAPVQLRHGWRGLALAAGIPCVLAALVADVWALTFPADGGTTAVAVLVVSLLGVVAAVVTAGFGRVDQVTAIGLLVAAPAPALLAAPLVERTNAGLIAAAVAVVLAAVWVVGRYVLRERLTRAFVAAAGGAAAVAAVQATMIFIDPSAWATALLCEALLLTLGAFSLRSGGVLVGALAFGAFGSVIALFHEVPVLALLDVAEPRGIVGVLVGLMIAAVALLVPLTAVRLEVLSRDSTGLWVLPGIVLLYGTAGATMALVQLFRDDRTGFLTAHILITLSWVVAAIALLLRGIRRTHLRVAGMVLMSVSLAKLFLFDLATLDGFARVAAFLCAGLVLLAAGVRYARLVSAQG